MTAETTAFPSSEPSTIDRGLFFGGNLPMDGVLNALSLEPYLMGVQPHSRSADLSEVPADAALLPPGVTAELTHEQDGQRSHVVRRGDWTLLALRRRAGGAFVRVVATSAELADRILDDTVATARNTAASDSALSVGFWHTAPCRGDGVYSPRTVELPSWQAIRRNYSHGSVSALDELMSVRPASVNGRLLLLHGPAGTGKTTAVRALAQEWRDWCRVDHVLDPDALFSDTGYLTSVVLGQHRNDSRKWRLLVLEDCDELVGADAKHEAGQALSRLLNLTDGMLGQGLNILVCLTTNENVARLHPAVVRPGRCLAEIEIGPLSRAEATSWLGADVHEDTTLAELYNLRANGIHT